MMVIIIVVVVVIIDLTVCSIYLQYKTHFAYIRSKQTVRDFSSSLKSFV